MDYRRYTFKGLLGLNFNLMIKNNDVKLIAIKTEKDKKGIKKIKIPDKITVINNDGTYEKREITNISNIAFAGFDNLQEIYIPKSVRFIDESLFVYVIENVTVRCDKGSYAEKWARDNGLKTVPTYSKLKTFLNTQIDTERT